MYAICMQLPAVACTHGSHTQGARCICEQPGTAHAIEPPRPCIVYLHSLSALSICILPDRPSGAVHAADPTRHLSLCVCHSYTRRMRSLLLAVLAAVSLLSAHPALRKSPTPLLPLSSPTPGACGETDPVWNRAPAPPLSIWRQAAEHCRAMAS